MWHCQNQGRSPTQKKLDAESGEGRRRNQGRQEADAETKEGKRPTLKSRRAWEETEARAKGVQSGDALTERRADTSHRGRRRNRGDRPANPPTTPPEGNPRAPGGAQDAWLGAARKAEQGPPPGQGPPAEYSFIHRREARARRPNPGVKAEIGEAKAGTDDGGFRKASEKLH